MDDIVTSDLSNFGYREIREAINLLNAYLENPTIILEDGLKICFNTHSGYVFLSDEEYNVYMVNNNKLEQWHNCPICGAEGFLEEVGDIHNHEDPEDKECQEWIDQIRDD